MGLWLQIWSDREITENKPKVVSTKMPTILKNVNLKKYMKNLKKLR